MIWHIAKKDFLLNIISARFVIGLILCLLVIPFTVFVNIDSYKNQQRLYLLDQKNADDNLKQARVYSALRPEIIKPPSPLSIFSNGINGNVGNKVKINFGEIQLMAEGKASVRDNPFLNSFFSIDFIKVIAILISLLALIFSYDLFTREREDGTMKLALSKGISRSVFAAGKVTGVFITLLPVLLLCYLLILIITFGSKDISFTSTEWINIILVFLISIFYMAIFVMIGALISSITKRSSTSIILILLCWVWFVFIVPNITTLFAESFVETSRFENVRYSLNELDREYNDYLYKEKEPELRKETGLKNRSWWNANGGMDGYFETSGTAWETMDFERQLRAAGEPVRIDYADKKWAIQKAYIDGLIKQSRLQQTLSWLSPSVVFEQVSSGLCMSDTKAYLDFMQSTRAYREILINHFNTNKWFSSFRYITAQPVDQIVKEEEQRIIQQSGQIPECWSYNNNPALDLSEVPMFQYRPKGISELINQALLKMIVLLLGGIVMFVLTQWSFNKYDIR